MNSKEWYALYINGELLCVQQIVTQLQLEDLTPLDFGYSRASNSDTFAVLKNANVPFSTREDGERVSFPMAV